MADKSKIAWCDATINPCYGCSPVSPACDNCYAARPPRSLILSPHEVRAAMAGTLGLVVRPMKHKTSCLCGHPLTEHREVAGHTELGACGRFIPGIPCPLGVPGDRLVGKETWRVEELEDGLDVVMFKDGSYAPIENTPEASDLWIVAYDNGKHGLRWRSPATMPAWASRITLEVIGVRCVRIDELRNEDFIACGFVPRLPDGREWLDLLAQFVGSWDRRHGKQYLYQSRPFVWAVNVRRVEG